jgi:hypothetical protein
VKIPKPTIFDKKRNGNPSEALPENEPMTVYYETKIVDGCQTVKTHRVPLAQWDTYAKENGL